MKTSGNSDTELDFTEHWSFFNVQQEILRGIQLRQEKPVVNEAEYDLIDVDFSIPSCSKRKRFKDHQNIRTGKKVNHRRYRKVTKKKYTRISKQKSKDQNCPLRIVELAEPLKRQCLNTWKNNCRVLPDYMVDRLRRHVEDKHPVVQIKDAVNYFKKKKHTTKKCSSKRTTSKNSSERNIRDILLLSAIFGYKITQKLKSPANIILSPELSKINHIVRDEINSILRNKKGKDIYKNDKILIEMSKKVTIWIASVLEETSYKLLLEQLDELEEEEGPVLDFIDELLDNIPILCESSTSTEFTEENDIISTISSGDNNMKVTESIHEAISEDTIDIEKPDYKVPANIDPLLTNNVEEMISDNEINDINEQNDTKNHLRRLLEDRINYIVSDAGNVDIEDINNIETFGSNVNLPSSLNDANIDLPLNLENNINSLVLGTDEEHINKNDTFISLDDLEAAKTRNTASDDSKAEFLSNIENAINEVSSNLDDNTNNKRLSTDKEFINKDATIISLDDLDGDNVESNTAFVGSRTDLSPRMENIINELPVTLENNITDLLPSEEKEYVNQDNNFILLENTAESDRPKYYTSENIEQSKYLPEGVDEQQNDSILESHTVDETEEESEEGTKKVKFSHILDNLRNNSRINKFELESYDYKQPVAWKSSKEYISSHFNLAPANPNLLSNMDELWPEYTLPPLLKATESVSKSVTSLGRIIESDERSLMSPIHKSSEENVKNSINKGPDFTKINTIDVDRRMYNKIDSTMLEEDLLNEVFTKEWQRESKSTTDKMSIMNNKEDPKISLTARENIIQDCGDVKNIKHNIATQCDMLHTKISLANIFISDIIATRNNTKIKIDQNVQTNAVIIFSMDDEVGLKNYDLKKWCIGLENVTANLELWAEWIQNVCINASRLKRKRNTSKSCQFATKHINEWIDLKQSINIDVQRWIELKRHLSRGLNKYKKTFGTKKASFIQADKKNCKCNKNFQKNEYPYMF